jgi:hypothetical protein
VKKTLLFGALIGALTLSACGSSEPPPSPEDGGALDLSVTVGPSTVTGTFSFSLDAGAYPPSGTYPNVLVYFPSAFNPTPPLSVIVWLHGFNNCVENVVRDAGQACTPDGGVRSAYALAAQLEASGRNAMLVVPELKFDQATGAPGTLGLANGLRDLLNETFADLSPQLGNLTTQQIGKLIVASHSGGYQAAAGIAARGGVPVAELYLFDSLYGNFTDFDSWVKMDLTSLQGSPPPRRFADVYGATGGTQANSQAMAGRAVGWVGTDGGVLVDNRTSTMPPDAVLQHGLFFQFSALAHDIIPREWFLPLLRTSTLPAK